MRQSSEDDGMVEEVEKHGYNNSSESASSDNSSSGDSSSDNEENDDAKNSSDSGDSVLDSEFAELATMMKTSLNQENGINNLNLPR
ncbi:16934_t:CDS:2 [Entrophospora sp. SA101]|nr:16934_t:CDS:2 [Entrophospora sp. SA101]